MSGLYSGAVFKNGLPVSGNDLTEINVISNNQALNHGVSNGNSGWNRVLSISTDADATKSGSLVVGPVAGSLNVKLDCSDLVAFVNGISFPITGNAGKFQDISIPDNNSANPAYVALFLEVSEMEVDSSSPSYTGGNFDLPIENDFYIAPFKRNVSNRKQIIYRFRAYQVSGGLFDASSDARIFDAKSTLGPNPGETFSYSGKGLYTAGDVCAIPVCAVFRLGRGAFGNVNLSDFNNHVSGGLLDSTLGTGFSESDRPDGFLQDVVYPEQVTITATCVVDSHTSAKKTFQKYCRGELKNNTRKGGGSVECVPMTFGCSTVNGSQVGKGVSYLGRSNYHTGFQSIIQPKFTLLRSDGTHQGPNIQFTVEIDLPSVHSFHVGTTCIAEAYDSVDGVTLGNYHNYCSAEILSESTMRVTISAEWDSSKIVVFVRANLHGTNSSIYPKGIEQYGPKSSYWSGGLFPTLGNTIKVGGNWEYPIKSVSHTFSRETLPYLEIECYSQTGSLSIPLESGMVTCGNFSYKALGLNKIISGGESVGEGAGFAYSITDSSIHVSGTGIMPGTSLVRIHVEGVYAAYGINVGGVASLYRMEKSLLLGTGSFGTMNGYIGNGFYDHPLSAGYFEAGTLSRIHKLNNGVYQYAEPYSKGRFTILEGKYVPEPTNYGNGFFAENFPLVQFSGSQDHPIFSRSSLRPGEQITLFGSFSSEQRAVGGSGTIPPKKWNLVEYAGSSQFYSSGFIGSIQNGSKPYSNNAYLNETFVADLDMSGLAPEPKESFFSIPTEDIVLTTQSVSGSYYVTTNISTQCSSLYSKYVEASAYVVNEVGSDKKLLMIVATNVYGTGSSFHDGSTSETFFIEIDGRPLI